MTKRTWAWIGVGILTLVAFAVAAFGLTGARTIRLSGEEIQKRVDAQLPKTHKGITVTKVGVTVRESDVLVAIAVEGEKLGQHFVLEAEGAGVPAYEREAFFFKPSKITVTKLELKGEGITEKLARSVDRYITDPKTKERAQGALPGLKRWIDDNIESHILAALAKTPIYTPKNDLKGYVIRATLEGITVKDGAIVAKLSLLEFTKTVILGIFLLVGALAMLGALIACPEWGAALLVVGSLS